MRRKCKKISKEFNKLIDDHYKSLDALDIASIYIYMDARNANDHGIISKYDLDLPLNEIRLPLFHTYTHPLSIQTPAQRFLPPSRE